MEDNVVLMGSQSKVAETKHKIKLPGNWWQMVNLTPF